MDDLIAQLRPAPSWDTVLLQEIAKVEGKLNVYDTDYPKDPKDVHEKLLLTGKVEGLKTAFRLLFRREP